MSQTLSLKPAELTDLMLNPYSTVRQRLALALLSWSSKPTCVGVICEMSSSANFFKMVVFPVVPSCIVCCLSNECSRNSRTCVVQPKKENSNLFLVFAFQAEQQRQ